MNSHLFQRIGLKQISFGIYIKKCFSSNDADVQSYQETVFRVLEYILEIIHCTEDQLFNFANKCQILFLSMSDQEYQ